MIRLLRRTARQSNLACRGGSCGAPPHSSPDKSNNDNAQAASQQAPTAATMNNGHGDTSTNVIAMATRLRVGAGAPGGLPPGEGPLCRRPGCERVALPVFNGFCSSLCQRRHLVSPLPPKRNRPEEQADDKAKSGRSSSSLPPRPPDSAARSPRPAASEGGGPAIGAHDATGS